MNMRKFTEKSVSALSSACGFMSACYFSKVFKKVMGKTPAVYIREHGTKSREENR